MWIYIISWLLVEAVYVSYIYIFFLKSVDRVRNPGRFVMPLEEAVAHMRRMCETIIAVSNIEEFVEGFFCGSPLRSLRRDNVYSFIAWAFTGQDYFEVKQRPNEELIKPIESCMAILEEYFPSEMAQIKPGYNRNVRHVSMCLDPVNFIHRPFLFYVFINIFNAFYDYICMPMGGWRRSYVSIASHEVNHRRSKGEYCLSYFYRNPNRFAMGTRGDEKPPLIFLHGISYGWILYMDFLSAFLDRPIYILDVGTIRIGSLSCAHPSPRAFAGAVKRILGKHGHTKADVVGHSFGTMLASSVVNYCPEVLGDSLVLIDPVCLLLSLPDVAYNFLYKPPTSIVDWMLVLGASRELTVARTLYRDFIWFEGDMVLERIPLHVSVHAVVAENDDILCAPKIKAYLDLHSEMREKLHNIDKGKISVMYMKDMMHGGVLFSSSHAMSLAELMNEMRKSNDSV